MPTLFSVIDVVNVMTATKDDDGPSVGAQVGLWVISIIGLLVEYTIEKGDSVGASVVGCVDVVGLLVIVDGGAKTYDGNEEGQNVEGLQVSAVGIVLGTKECIELGAAMIGVLDGKHVKI